MSKVKSDAEVFKKAQIRSFGIYSEGVAKRLKSRLATEYDVKVELVKLIDMYEIRSIRPISMSLSSYGLIKAYCNGYKHGWASDPV